MAARGRKSAAELSVAAPVGVIGRLAPPASLTAAQKAVWVSITNSRPAEWFGPEHAPMLTQYCRHKTSADVLAQQLQKFKPEWMAEDDGLERYDKLAKMLERETRAMNALARSMRLTQQSTYNAQKASTLERGVGGGRKPWQVDDE